MALFPGRAQARLVGLAVLTEACFFNAQGSAGLASETGSGSASASSGATATSLDPAPTTTGEPTTTTTTTSTTTSTNTTDATAGTTAVEPGTTTTTHGPDTTSNSATSDDTSGDSSSSTTGPGTTTTGSSTSTGVDTTTGPACIDSGLEPNESEFEAVDLGSQYCKASPKSFEGVLDGEGDVDWHRFFGDFSGNGCNNLDPDPIAKIVVTADGPLEACMFAECDIQGDVGFTCPNGTIEDYSPDGRKGCCGAGSMEYTVNCVNGGDESAMMYVRLRSADSGACVPYKVDYSYRSF